MELRIVPGQGKLEHLIHVGRHTIISDAGIESGGEDKGPTPHDLLSASLGACTAITIKMYANHKNLSLKNVEVRIDQTKEGDTTVFNRKIKFEGELNDAQVKRLFEIADQCPVHKVLSGKILIKTTPL